MIKLQHLTVIFVVIMVPITFLVSFYIQSQIDSILIQSKYDTQLMDATYDAVQAFQLNTLNNNYSTISNSKIRDIEASIATFYNSLATSMGSSATSKETIKNYTPALVYNLYDGYYIYNNHYNTELKDSNGNTQQEYGLGPYVYYSCRYVKNKGLPTVTDCVVNFTLDNAITVYGTINGTYYSPRTGYLINPDKLVMTGGNIKQTIDNAINQAINSKTQTNLDVAVLARQIVNGGSLSYDGVQITSENNLGEYLLMLTQTGNNVTSNKQYYRYTYYNNRKVYADKDSNRK